MQDSEKMNFDSESDTLNLESIKSLPSEDQNSLLPESMNTGADTSGVVP